MTPTPLHRAVTIVCAIVAAAAVGTQFLLVVAEKLGEGQGVFAGIWQLMAYFTNWSNLCVAVVATAAAFRLSPGLGGPRAVLLVLPSIIVVSLSYNLLLRDTMSEVSPLREVVRMAMHDVTPPLFLALFLTAPHPQLTWRDAAWALPLPLTYAVYSLTRGLSEGWFPYWFLDLTKLSMPDFLRNVVLFIAGLYILGLIVVAVDRALAFRRARA